MCKDLERKIDELQKENAYLRQLLENAGIVFMMRIRISQYL